MKKHTSSSAENPIAFYLRRLKLQRLFRRKIGWKGDFEAPRNYMEKVQFRKLYGNHESYARLADKYGVRNYVAERAGEQYLVPMYAVCDQLTPEIVAGLPDQFIIKATHGCNWNRIVKDKSATDTDELISYLNSTTKMKYGSKTGEYHYRLIKPRLIAEQLLLDSNGNLPYDYYIFCYNTSRGFDYSIAISSPGITSAAHYKSNWERWDSSFTEEEHARYAQPDNFPEMLEVARKLSAGLDFARIDLYNVDGRIYFGEITVTPNAGLGRVTHTERLKHRSDKWEIDGSNPYLYTRAPL